MDDLPESDDTEDPDPDTEEDVVTLMTSEALAHELELD